MADRFGLRQDIQFETTVNQATYDEDAGAWVIRTDHGDRVTARYLITAAGCLSATNIPNIPGLDSFQGDWYHTSRWPKEGVDLKGKRVGVIGTGSTGIQAIPVMAESAVSSLRVPAHAELQPAHGKRADGSRYTSGSGRHATRSTGSRTATPMPAGTCNHPTSSVLDVPPDERDRIFEEAWREGAFAMMQAFKDLRTSAEANEVAAEFVRRQIRQTVKDPRGRGSVVPEGLSNRNEAPVPRPQLLPDIQPGERHFG